MALKLKTLGLALIASLALSAMVVSTASATTAIVNGGPYVTGVKSKAEGAKNELTSAAAVACTTATYSGTAVASTITLTPSFSGCTGSNGLPVTITVNGCAYKLTMGALSGTTAPVSSVQLECPAEKSIDVHFYTDAKHEVPRCTFTIGAQTPTVGTLMVVDNPDTTLTVTGAVTAITSAVSGSCLTEPSINRPNHNPIPVASALHTDIIVSGAGDLETEE